MKNSKVMRNFFVLYRKFAEILLPTRILLETQCKLLGLKIAFIRAILWNVAITKSGNTEIHLTSRNY